MSKDLIQVQTEHPIYQQMIGIWELLRDTIKGANAVKSRGAKYLPNPFQSGPNEQKYENYKDRAQWFNATGQSKKAYVGLMFSKPPVVELPDTLDQFKENPTRDNKTFNTLMVDIADQVVAVDKVGILVDMPSVENQDDRPMTQQRVQDEKLFPYWAVYKAESIINWFVKKDGSENELKLVVLKEIQVETKDIFTREEKTIFRVLRIDDQGLYVQELWIEGEERPFKTIEPKMNGQRMTIIPFFVLNRDGIEYTSDKEPILFDVAMVNIGHYRNSADHESILTKSAMPTFFGYGYSDKATLNPGDFNKNKNEGAKVELLQAQPQSAIRDEMEEKKQQMSALAIQAITGQGRYVASADTSNNQRHSEVSILAMIANSVSRSLERVCQFTDKWITGKEVDPKNYSIQIQNEYRPDGLPAPIMMSMLENLKGGAWGKSTYDYNMRQNGLYDPSKTDDELNKEIKENPYVSPEEQLPGFDEDDVENVE